MLLVSALQFHEPGRRIVRVMAGALSAAADVRLSAGAGVAAPAKTRLELLWREFIKDGSEGQETGGDQIHAGLDDRPTHQRNRGPCRGCVNLSVKERKGRRGE